MPVDWDRGVRALTRRLGGPITYMPASGGSYPICGVYEEPSVTIAIIDEERDLVTTEPVLGIRLADIPVSPAQNDAVWVKDVNSTFLVREVLPDGVGFAKLSLNFMSSP